MKLLRHTRFWVSVGLIFVDGFFFMLTNPAKVASYLLIVGFLLLAVTLYYFVGNALTVAQYYGVSINKHRRRFALFATGGIGGLLALQSMGELTPRDAVVLLPLAVVLYMYLSYGRANLKT